MHLDPYLTQLAAGGTEAPASLQLQKAFAGQLYDLYRAAEERGLERGGPLLYDKNTGTFAIGEIAEGQPFSMNIPETDHAGNFGDVHAHPSASIGHAGGHSAHSMEDLWNFRKTVNKPYWIQFVVAGTWLYAMVQINGVSKWDNSIPQFRSDRTDVEVRQMTNMIEKRAGGTDKWDALKHEAAEADLRAGKGDELRYEAFIAEWKNKAKIGPLMQELSVRHCAEFAWEYNFLFYTGQGTTLTRMLSA